MEAHQILSLELHKFFGRSVSVEPRALASLGVVTRPTGKKPGGRAPHHVHIWSALRLNLPAVQQLYEALSYEPQGPRPHMEGVIPFDPTEHRIGSGGWTNAFRRVFTRMGPVGRPDYDELTPTAHEMQDAGRITALGLAKSLLESGTSNFPLGLPPIRGLGIRSELRLREKGTSGQVQGPRSGRPNSPLRYLGAGVGLGMQRNWSDEIVDLSSRATTLLDGLAHFDEALGDQQFIVYHDGKRYRLAPIAATRGCTLREGDHQWPARGNVTQAHESILVSAQALQELEVLIDGNAPEKSFQHFFEEHPGFLTSLGPYSAAYPQLVLRRDDGVREIPDFFLERLDTGFCDLLDLKRASQELVRRQPRRTRFRDAVMEAVAQLEGYRDYFEDRENRRRFRDDFGLEAYRPRVVVVIGRRRAFEDAVERIRLESRLPGWVELKTYDDIHAEAERWRASIQ